MNFVLQEEELKIEDLFLKIGRKTLILLCPESGLWVIIKDIVKHSRNEYHPKVIEATLVILQSFDANQSILTTHLYVNWCYCLLSRRCLRVKHSPSNLQQSGNSEISTACSREYFSELHFWSATDLPLSSVKVSFFIKNATFSLNIEVWKHVRLFRFDVEFDIDLD